MALTVTAGTPGTAAEYNALIPKYTVQGSDQALTSTGANWNAGAITIAANETWECQLYIDYGNASAATSNLQLTWATPTGTATISRLMSIGPTAGGLTAPSDVNGGFQARANNSAISYGNTTSTTLRGLAYQSFVVAGGVSGGTIQLTLQMSTAASTGTAYAGSKFIAHRVL